MYGLPGWGEIEFSSQNDYIQMFFYNKQQAGPSLVVWSSGGQLDNATKVLDNILALNPPRKSLVTSDSLAIVNNSVNQIENQMNELFDYGQKAIFKSNKKEFINKDVEDWLNKLYDMLKANTSLKIKITWYYWGTHSELPLQRAEVVKKYLVNKWIDSNRIEIEWGEEMISRSIQIIIK